MAKASDARDAKKSSGIRVPDAVPGADWINGALHSPVVREAVAAALVAGAAAAASVLAKSNTGAGKMMRDGAAAVADEGQKAGDLTKSLTDAAVGTVVELASGVAKSLGAAPAASKSRAAGKRGDDPARAKPKSRDASGQRKAGAEKKRKS